MRSLFVIILGVFCSNNGVLYRSCDQCEQTNDTITNSWCDGNCFFDSTDQNCKEKEGK